MTHQEFEYLNGQPGSRASEAYTTLSNGTVGEDCEGHGTHVAACVGGLTFGVAKNVTLHAVGGLVTEWGFGWVGGCAGIAQDAGVALHAAAGAQGRVACGAEEL